MLFDPEAAYAAERLGGRFWLVSQLLKAGIHASLFGWGLLMLGTGPFRVSVVACAVAFCILAGIGWHKAQQASVAIFGIGLMVWAHIPIVDRAIELVAAALRC